MDYHNANSPAFPGSYQDRNGDTYYRSGMTKRELIAAEIMGALVEGWAGSRVSLTEVDNCCGFAVLIADRLLSKLSKTEP